VKQKLLLSELEVTKDQILEYARGLVKRYPLRIVREYDISAKEFKDCVVDNDLKHELACILGRWHAMRLTWMKASDLREELHGMLMDGVAPLTRMDTEELVDEIWDAAVVPVVEENPDATWDDLLEARPDIFPADYEDYDGYPKIE